MRRPDPLDRIKRLARNGKIAFTTKAREEMDEHELTKQEVLEAVCNATRIDKLLASRNPRTGARERLYVIKGSTMRNVGIYTKDKIHRTYSYDVPYESETIYTFISAKLTQ